MDSRRLALSLARKYKTRDPFRIAEAMGYTIIFTPLVGVRGFYQFMKRCHIIYLDDSLDENEARFVCAHELGHSLLHRGFNRIFMDTRTLMRTGRYEREADRFAADLIYDDADLQDFLQLPLPTAAACLGLSEDVAAYRLQGIQCSFY